MKKTARKNCPCCCPDGRFMNIMDRSSDENGKPSWECRNCHSHLPRRTRRSSASVAFDLEWAGEPGSDPLENACRALGIDVPSN